MSIQWLQKRRQWRVRVAVRVEGKIVERSRWVPLQAGETKKESERRAKAIEAELAAEIDALRQRATVDAEITFAHFIEVHYWTRCASSTLNRAGGENNPRTLLTKQSLVKSRLPPFFGNLRLSDINQAVIDAYAHQEERATFERCGECRRYSKCARANNLKVLRHILRMAKAMKLIESCPEITLPQRIPVKRERSKGSLTPEEFFTPVEVQRLLAQAEEDGPSWYAMFVVLLRAGLRIGEVVGLRWQDIDFRKRVLHVRWQFSRGIQGPPKSGVRDVPLHAVVADALKSMPHGDGPFVWPLATDPEKPLAPEMVRRRGKKYAKRANIEKGFWPHACRHTAASTFLAAGVPLNVVASWMGHSVLTLTKVYAHLAPEVSQRLMAGLDFDDDGEVEVEAAE